jgi:DNA repair exonuclease SbcCD ATPase subunit
VNVTTPVRQRLGRAVRKSAPMRELRAELAIQVAQNERLAARSDRLLREQGKKLDEMTRSVSRLQERVGPLEHAAGNHDADLSRSTGQIEAIEQRLATLEDHPLVDGPLTTDDESTAEARTLLSEVRHEHAQIRARMQLITWYEERLRRVEATLTDLYDGDARHPV